MTTYTIYLPPEDAGLEPDEVFRLVPDTKATLALIFPPFWLAWHKLWLPLMVYIVVITAILMLAVWSPGIAVSYLSILPGLYLLLEGYELVRQNLEAKGWQYAGVVEGENREEAKIRYLVSVGDSLSEEKPKARLATSTVFQKPNSDPNTPPKNTMSLFPE